MAHWRHRRTAANGEAAIIAHEFEDIARGSFADIGLEREGPAKIAGAGIKRIERWNAAAIAFAANRAERGEFAQEQQRLSAIAHGAGVRADLEQP